MYSFIYTSKLSQFGMDSYLLHILFNDVIIESTFVDFPLGTSQETLDLHANNKIDLIEGLE